MAVFVNRGFILSVIMLNNVVKNYPPPTKLTSSMASPGRIFLSGHWLFLTISPFNSAMTLTELLQNWSTIFFRLADSEISFSMPLSITLILSPLNTPYFSVKVSILQAIVGPAVPCFDRFKFLIFLSVYLSATTTLTIPLRDVSIFDKKPARQANERSFSIDHVTKKRHLSTGF